MSKEIFPVGLKFVLREGRTADGRKPGEELGLQILLKFAHNCRSGLMGFVPASLSSGSSGERRMDRRRCAGRDLVGVAVLIGFHSYSAYACVTGSGEAVCARDAF